MRGEISLSDLTWESLSLSLNPCDVWKCCILSVTLRRGASHLDLWVIEVRALLILSFSVQEIHQEHFRYPSPTLFKTLYFSLSFLCRPARPIYLHLCSFNIEKYLSSFYYYWHDHHLLLFSRDTKVETIFLFRYFKKLLFLNTWHLAI